MSDNPFKDDHHSGQDDPFADPSITHALTTQASHDGGATLHDPEPYSTSKSGSKPGGSQGYSSVSDSVDAVLDGEREAELRRREEELKRREEELSQRQEEMRLHGGGKPPNFPPFYPFMYHDIDVEIPEASRKVVRYIFWAWIGTLLTMVWNAVSCFLILVSHATGVTTGGSDFGVSFVYIFTISISSFFLWYRPAYNAFMKERSLYYYFYFVFNGFHIAFSYYMLVGIPGSGSAGLINTISMLSDGKVLAGIFGLIDSIFWAAGGTGNLWLYKLVHRHYREEGHTFADAKGDAFQTVVTSSAGRNVMGGYAQSSAGNQV
ncbi:MAG: scamp family-domain-containing protein [Piptocephalis tieghemiana]|nr:MAG: scamp family-domain-containing protein [Piptocephalis tieghemiana]